jgi:hypothetical protein
VRKARKEHTPMKNITFTADELVIEAARQQARAEDTTLNEQFRLWLASYAQRQRLQRFDEVLRELRGTVSTAGRKFTREEMNER